MMIDIAFAIRLNSKATVDVVFMRNIVVMKLEMGQPQTGISCNNSNNSNNNNADI